MRAGIMQSPVIKNENITKTTKTNIIKKQPLLFAAALCFVFLFFYLMLNGFDVRLGNDDYCIFKLINYGDLGIGCVGYFFTSFIALIQPLFGSLNSYTIVQEFLVVMSIVSINYVILSKLKTKTGLFLASAFDISLFSFLFMEIHFTYTSSISCTAGALLILFSTVYENRKKIRIVQFICGFLLLFFGSQVRFDPILPVCAFIAVLTFGNILVTVLRNRKNKEKKAVFKNAFANNLKPGAVIAAAFVLVFALQLTSSALKKTVKSYETTNEYNIAISNVVDYGTANYEKNRQAYNDIGINDPSDLTTLKNWYIDDEFFTVDRLQKIAELSQNSLDRNTKGKNIFEYIMHSVSDGLSKNADFFTIILFSIGIIILGFATLILALLFPKIRSTVLRISVFALLWAVFFLIAGGFREANLLILPLAVLTLYFSAKYNNKQYIIILLLSLLLIVFYLYLASLRLLFYSTCAVIIPAWAFIIFVIRDINESEIYQNGGKFRIFPILLAVLTFISSTVTGQAVFHKQAIVDKNGDNKKLVEYIKNHPDKIFVINQTKLLPDYCDPFVLPEEKPNLINYGLWLTKAGYFQNGWKQNGIEHIFRDSVDSDVRLVGSVILPKGLIDYYNNHYAEDGKIIKLVTTDKVGSYSIIKVVSEKADENTNN